MRILPHSEEAEAAYLAAILLAPVPVLERPVHERVFYLDRHKVIYRAMLEVEQEYGASEVCLQTVQVVLETQGKLAEVGGVAYLAELDLNLPDLSRLSTLVDILEQHHQRRELILLGHRLIAEAPSGDPAAVRDRTVDRLAVMAGREGEKTYVSMGDSAACVLDGAAGEVKLGIDDLDRILGGFSWGQLVLMAGRPGMGKSSMMTSCADYAPRLAKIPTGIISMEMSTPELMRRMCAKDLGIGLKRIIKRHVTTAERERIKEWVARTRETPLWIHDGGGRSVNRIVSEMRTLRARHGVRVVWIDQLEFITPAHRSGSISADMTETLKVLKGAAKDLEMVVVLLHQLNRLVEHRTDQKPRSSDLSQAGEKEADVILLLWRPLFATRADRNPADPERAVVVVEKQRDGASGVEAPVEFVPELTHYRSV